MRSATAAALILAVGAGGAAQAKTEFSFWHAMGGRLGEIVDEFTGKFNDQSATCSLVSTYKGNYTETMTGAIAAFRAGEQPTIVQVFEVGTATMMSAEGAIYPVEDLLTDQGYAFDRSAYLPAVISYYTTPEGKLLSLPFNSSTPVLWYNKSKLDELGIAVPTTWDELEAAASAAKEGGVEAPFSFGWQSWTQIENFAAWHDIPTGTQANGFAGLDTELKINSDEIVAHVDRIKRMGDKGLFKYGGRRGDSRAMFVNGDTIFWINSSAYYGGFKKDIQSFEFGQTMMPLDASLRAEPQNSIIGGATLWVLRGGQDAEYACAAEFLSFLSAEDNQASWHQETGYVPITTAAYKLSEQQGFYNTDPGTDTAIKQLSLNQPTANSKGLRYGNFVQIRDVINEELEAVWSGEKDAKTALDTAVERGNALLRKFEAAN